MLLGSIVVVERVVGLVAVALVVTCVGGSFRLGGGGCACRVWGDGEIVYPMRLPSRVWANRCGS